MNPPKSDSSEILPSLATGVPADAGQLILERRRRLVETTLQGTGGHLLDFGCGNGAQTLKLVPGFDHTTAVDINEDYLAGFRSALAGSAIADKVTLLTTGGGKVDLPDAAVDVATSFTVLEHVPSEAEVLAELYRLLKPGGRLFLTVPNRWWIFETHGADLPLLPWNRVPLVSWWPKKLHDRWARARIYRRGEIIGLVQEAGFQVDEVFHLTAPMDMIKWSGLRRLVRQTLFRGDRTNFPFLATEIVVTATR